MKTTVHSARLKSGMALQYAEQGSSSGLPVVFLHGYTDSWRSFCPLLAHLPPSVRAVVISQRGHGDSDRPAQGYGAADFAADVAELLESLGIASAVLVGHCMGAQVAMRFALDYPDRTLGLGLLGAYPTMRGNPVAEELWRGVSRMTDPVDPDFVREFQKSTLAQRVPDAFLNTVVAESLKLPAQVWRTIFKGILSEDFSAALARVDAPVLLMWGARDGLCSRSDQDALLHSLRRAELAVYPDAGHSPHWEQPARITADIVSFVQGRTAAAA